MRGGDQGCFKALVLGPSSGAMQRLSTGQSLSSEYFQHEGCAMLLVQGILTSRFLQALPQWYVSCGSLSGFGFLCKLHIESKASWPSFRLSVVNVGRLVGRVRIFRFPQPAKTDGTIIISFM